MKKIFLLLFVLLVIMTGCQPPFQQQESVFDSPVNTRSAFDLNIYYGTLHNHTYFSDGTGSPASAYIYARDTAHLDFLGLADHSNDVTLDEWNSIKSAANTYNNDGTFVAFAGFEWSSFDYYGHVAVINTTDICRHTEAATDTFSELVAWLDAREGIAFFNHPGREDDHGVEFDYFASTPAAKFVGMELWNKNDAFDVFYYNDGYYPNDGNMSFYDEALQRGWKIGASGSDDNHDGTYGTRNDYRMAVIADSLTRNNIYAALKGLHFYSTLDKNLKLSFLLNGSQMGNTIESGTYDAVISAYDTENFNRIELLRDGVVIQTWNMNAPDPLAMKTVTTVDGEYYYVRVHQVDGGEAISSPIFIVGTPTDEPTVEPTDEPTLDPTPEPTEDPTPDITPDTSDNPTAAPTDMPTGIPTSEPSVSPTPEPSIVPTDAPSGGPTSAPTSDPSVVPTTLPTGDPTSAPSVLPTDAPTAIPTGDPSIEPTAESSMEPV